MLAAAFCYIISMIQVMQLLTLDFFFFFFQLDVYDGKTSGEGILMLKGVM